MTDKIRRNLHIKILEYAQKHMEFADEDIFKDLNFNQSEKSLFCQKFIHDGLLIENTKKSVPNKSGGGERNLWTISTEGRFKLLEHQQLWWAKFLSITAIVISLIMAVITTFLSLQQPVILDAEQFDVLREIRGELNNLNGAINSLTEAQKKLFTSME